MEIRNVPFCVISFCIIFLLPNLLSVHGIHKFPHNGDSHRQADGDVYKVLVNGTAKIRCDVSSNSPNDQVLLVVWYKNNLPIYSYDTRGAHAGTPSEWHDMEVLENRARLDKNNGPAVLIIDPVTEKDAGNFRCRVDFKLSPTRNSNVNLEVIVPPDAPRIFNEKREFVDSRAGPYEEGTELHLICVVSGGSPAPAITWSTNGHIVAGTSTDFSFPYSQSSKLVVHNLSRAHQHSVYTCQASNFEEKVVATNITIELYLRPLSVELLTGTQPLSADRRYDIQCQAVGSRPPAKITWWLNGTQVDSTNVTVSSDGNVSLSTLSFVPTRGHHNSVLACRANNELVKRGMKETFVKLNVFFVPTLTLVLGSNLNPMDIEEGDDVYFDCNVEANPAAYKIVWKHNGQTVQHNNKAGVIMSSSNLALQGITRHQAGNYTCIASNVEGDGESPWYPLKVMYKPICKPEQKRIYGVGRNEAADVLCEVDAYPAPESFKWSFNNTAETFDMPQSGYRLHSEQASTLTYTPVKEMDFGTIMCWADNVVGQQKEPCVFHLIAAGKPDQPYNCTVINQTSESLEVDCNEGFDGGQRQWFILELYDEEYGLLQANVTSPLYPRFNLYGLDPERAFKLLVYAANVKGRSGVVLLEANTLKAIEKPTLKFGQQYNQFELMSMLSIAIIVGVLAVLSCIGGLVYVVKLRWTKGQPHNHHLHHGLNHHHMQQKGKLAAAKQTSSSGGGLLLTTGSSSNNTPSTNSILRRVNNSALVRPGNLPIKDKILMPSHNNTSSSVGGGNSASNNIGGSGSNGGHHHPHHQLGGGGGIGGVGGSVGGDEQLYDEKNPDVVPYNKGITTTTTSPSISINNFHQMHHQQQQHQPQSGSYAAPPLPTGYHSPLSTSNNMNSNCSFGGGGGGGVSGGSGAATPVTLGNNNNNNTNSNNNMINNSNNNSCTNNINSNGTYPAKPPFLREIVTIRTPLIFTQQESCV